MEGTARGGGEEVERRQGPLRGIPHLLAGDINGDDERKKIIGEQVAPDRIAGTPPLSSHPSRERRCDASSLQLFRLQRPRRQVRNNKSNRLRLPLLRKKDPNIIILLIASVLVVTLVFSSSVTTTTTASALLLPKPSSSSTLKAAASPTTTSTPKNIASTTTTTAIMPPGVPFLPRRLPPPIVYTIAGSDSGGGAGIQADLQAIRSMGCHGCSAITCLTAQNSVGVTGVHAPPVDFLRTQLDALLDDLPPRAIKVGMLGSKELAAEVGAFLRKVKTPSSSADGGGGGGELPFVVVDPVMISTSGHRLIDEDAQQAMIDNVFPFADILTPNKYEAEALLNRTLRTPQDVEEGARDILRMGVKSVLIKGGHSLAEGVGDCDAMTATTPSVDDVNTTIGYAQDYLLSADGVTDRLCDGGRGVWIRSNRYDTENTHGTGCTLSSAIASALAIGHQQREEVEADASCGADRTTSGAGGAIDAADACFIGKAYVTAGIAHAVQLGKGPGPVTHTTFPCSYQHYPTVALAADVSSPSFLPMTRFHVSQTSDGEQTLGVILPIVDSPEWVHTLAGVDGVTDIQLRIKDESSPEKIVDMVKIAQDACTSNDVRLWVNDHWEAAIAARCFGVHLGQEDLASCVDNGGIAKMRDGGLALGISTHSYGELSAALGVKPSYVSLGPVFGTTSKKVAFDAQGLGTVRKWRKLIPPDIPLVAIGGIGDAEVARTVREAGADCVAVIGAVTKSENVGESVGKLTAAMS